MSAGNTLVESALDRKTGLYMSNCFAAHPDYSEWAKEQIAFGREIHTITIAQLLQHMDETEGE